MTAVLVVMAVALLGSAFFSASELSYFSLSDRVRILAEGRDESGALARLHARSDRLLVLLRLGDAVSDSVAAALAAYVGFALGGTPGLLAGIAGAALLILLVGELLPLRVAGRHGVRLTLALAPALLFLTRALSPLLYLLERLGGVITAVTPGDAARVAENEIRQLTVRGHTEGLIQEHERRLIERAFRLDETKAWEVMTPRVDIFAWPDERTLTEIVPELGTLPYSRVPVYGESIDDITGVLYVRDAYHALVTGGRDRMLRELAREPLVVPGSLTLTRLLRDFQTRRIHMAIVVDEYGGTDGLVTLEDVLEELVGEIVDETDVAEEPITRVSRGEIVAYGDVDLRELNHIFNTAFPLLEHRSLNGFLLDELGRVPVEGESLEREGLTIDVLEATETQVVRARLRRVAAADAEAPQDAAPAPQGHAALQERDDGGRGQDGDASTRPG
jgi:putative hemolysin